jgi:hypothetical protein
MAPEKDSGISAPAQHDTSAEIFLPQVDVLEFAVSARDDPEAAQDKAHQLHAVLDVCLFTPEQSKTE